MSKQGVASRAWAVFTAGCLWGGAALGHAQQAAPMAATPAPSAQEQSAPSVFSHVFRGFGVGVLAGSSVAYLVARRDGFEKKDWEAAAYGLGIGAMAGVTLGLGLGIASLSMDHAQGPSIVLKDILLGAAFGCFPGMVSGALSVIGNNEGERVGFGGAIGLLSGMGLGLILGVVEARLKGRRASRQGNVAHSLYFLPTPLSHRDTAGHLTWMPGFTGRF